MRAAKADKNQALLVNAFRGLGCSVISLHRVGQGCPDLAVGYGGHTMLVEVKSEKGTLTEDQRQFGRDWRGGIWLCRNYEDVKEIFVQLAALSERPPITAKLK